MGILWAHTGAIVCIVLIGWRVLFTDTDSAEWRPSAASEESGAEEVSCISYNVHVHLLLYC